MYAKAPQRDEVVRKAAEGYNNGQNSLYGRLDEAIAKFDSRAIEATERSKSSLYVAQPDQLVRLDKPTSTSFDMAMLEAISRINAERGLLRDIGMVEERLRTEITGANVANRQQHHSLHTKLIVENLNGYMQRLRDIEEAVKKARKLDLRRAISTSKAETVLLFGTLSKYFKRSYVDSFDSIVEKQRQAHDHEKTLWEPPLLMLGLDGIRADLHAIRSTAKIWLYRTIGKKRWYSKYAKSAMPLEGQAEIRGPT